MPYPDHDKERESVCKGEERNGRCFTKQVVRTILLIHSLTSSLTHALSYSPTPVFTNSSGVDSFMRVKCPWSIPHTHSMPSWFCAVYFCTQAAYTAINRSCTVVTRSLWYMKAVPRVEAQKDKREDRPYNSTLFQH